MLSVSIRFLAGRYHGTPWGRHVNEGAVEWPPSPWRVLRALVAAWKRTLPGLPQSRVEPILRLLAEPPQFVLPPASTGHTRHFMPWFKKGPDDRTMVFDTFVALPREAPVLIDWPTAALDSDQTEALSAILGNLNTFGRAESWCEARLESYGHIPGGFICAPLRGSLPAGHEIVRLLCADPSGAFDDGHVVTTQSVTVGRGKNRTTTETRSSIYD